MKRVRRTPTPTPAGAPQQGGLRLLVEPSGHEIDIDRWAERWVASILEREGLLPSHPPGDAA